MPIESATREAPSWFPRRPPDPGYRGDVLLLTAAQADRAARHAAAHLAARGIAAGQRIAVVTPEYAASSQAPAAQADALALVWAALRSGVIPVMIHPLLTAPEREFLLADSQVSATVATPAELASFTQPITSDDISDVPLTRPMHYTSGTTGTPKGVVARGSPEDAHRVVARRDGAMGLRPHGHHTGPLPLVPLRPLALRHRHPPGRWFRRLGR